MKVYHIILLFALGIQSACTGAMEHSESSPQDSQAVSKTAQAHKEIQSQIENISPKTYSKKLSEIPEAIQIDSRTPGEYMSGYIPGAINIDVNSSDFKEQIAKLDPSKTYFVNCKAGSRSMRACKIMQNAGFTKLYNLKGGILAWEKEGNELEFP